MYILTGLDNVDNGDADMNGVLNFNADGAFKLMQLTDIHYTDGQAADGRTLALMRELIAAEAPDMIIVTGDTVCGPDVYANIAAALAPVTEAGVPFGWVFGNHDVEESGTREGLFERVCALPGCMARHEADSGDGVGNCCLRLVNAEGAVEWLFMCLDSGDYMRLPGTEGYGYVTRAQTDWYVRQIAEQQRQTPRFGAMAFMHIPLPEHDAVWHREVCHGVRREAVCCAPVNSGMFTALLEAGHTRGVFVGHDHVNDYWGAMYGIALGYGRATGFNTYGAQDYLRGCRIFRFRQGNTESFETYVRLEHGIVVDEPWEQQPDGR